LKRLPRSQVGRLPQGFRREKTFCGSVAMMRPRSCHSDTRSCESSAASFADRARPLNIAFPNRKGLEPVDEIAHFHPLLAGSQAR
jgi:hypothetical protein